MASSVLMVAVPIVISSLIGLGGRAVGLAQQNDQNPPNPHSDLIFRATGAVSSADCHRTRRDGGFTALVQDNDRVRDLKAKAPGIHGPGRFADCLRCHAGGDKGVEKYRNR